ncbi:MAG: signal peptidase II [Alphaproteobacteria bacterium]|nr:signal peptidase II [Alphaproteobacteria bacterium]
MRRGLAIAALVIVIDQITKIWVVESLMRPEGVDHTPFFSPVTIELLPFFRIVMTWNTGVSFGIFNDGGSWNAIALSAVALAVVVALLFWLRQVRDWMVTLALGLVIGGALGNVIDRLRWGAVADFLDFHVGGMHWPAFNVADGAITIGAALLVVDALFRGPKSPKTEP